MSLICVNSHQTLSRIRLIDKNLESCLKSKTTTYKPDLPKLSKQMQGHCLLKYFIDIVKIKFYG